MGDEALDSLSIAMKYWARRESVLARRPFDRVYFIENDKGETVMHTNGPTKVIQPLPESVSGYKNIAPLASVEAKGMDKDSSAEYLNDQIIKNARRG